MTNEVRPSVNHGNKRWFKKKKIPSLPDVAAAVKMSLQCIVS